MIIGRLCDAQRYEGLLPALREAFSYLRTTDFTQLTPGRYDIDGERLYASVQRYDARPPETGIWEAHRRYIDVQYVFDGCERIGWSHIAALTPAQIYDEAGDCVLLRGDGDFLRLCTGDFAVFWPEDAHMPGVRDGHGGSVGKVVVKIRVE